MPLTVVYEDEDVLVIDKPAGLVTHPSPGRSTGTLVNALLARGGVEAYGTVAGEDRPGIVHRLDRDTSGLIVVARNDRAQAALMAQLKARRVKKTYLALVQGAVPAEIGRIEAPIGRDPRQFGRMAVIAGGRPSVTGYRVRERLPGWTLARGGSTYRSHAPDPGPSRVHRPPRCRRSCIRDGRGSTRTGRPRPAVPALLEDRVRIRDSADKLVRAEAPLPAGARVGAELVARGQGVTT